MALSNSLFRRKWLARSYKFIFRSSSSRGRVCLVPQYSQTATVSLLISNVPPHILHLKMDIVEQTPHFMALFSASKAVIVSPLKAGFPKQIAGFQHNDAGVMISAVYTYYSGRRSVSVVHRRQLWRSLRHQLQQRRKMPRIEG